MKKRIWKWLGFVSLVLLVSAAVWSYYYIYRPSKLLEAMMNGDKAEVTRLIDEEGYNPNVKMLNKTDMITLAFFLPYDRKITVDIDMMKFLLDKGIRPIQNEKGLPTMILLVLKDRQDIMELLVSYNYDVNVGRYTNSYSEKCLLTALDEAIVLGRKEMINFLLNNGGKLSCAVKSPEAIAIALLCIHQKKCPEILRNKFLEAGTKPELMKEIEAEIKKDTPTQGGNKK